MRKVTKRLLVAGFAAMVVGACQDSVSVVQPPPPPPPPTAPVVQATVTIQGLRAIPANTSVNPTAVAGDINVVLNVQENDETVTKVDLLLDGAPIGCANISANMAPGDGVSLSSSGGADVVECFWNTDDVQGTCVGNQLPPAFPNGTFTLGAQVTLSDGSTRTASNEQQVTLINSSFIMVGLVSEAGNQVIGSNGRLYHGGGDIDFGACPVSYGGTDVGSVSLVAADDPSFPNSTCDQDQAGTAHGACGDGDLGSGAGVPQTDASPPFVYTLATSNNDSFASGSGDAGTGVEDLGTGAGHTFMVTGSVFDANGMNVTSEFAGGMGAMTGFWVDMVPPRVNCSAGCAAFAASELTIDHPAPGSSTTVSWFSTGNFGLSNVMENGAGWSFGAGASMDVGDCSVAANSDAADVTPFVPLFADVSGIGDVTEEDPAIGTDGFAGTDSGNDCYLGELRSLADDVGNATSLLDPGAIPAQIQTATAFGKDATGPVVTNPLPALPGMVLNPDADANQGFNEATGAADACADLGDCTLMMDALDPNLASGDPGSGLDDVACSLAGGCTMMGATVVSGPTGSSATLPLNECDGPIGQVGVTCTDELVDPDFSVELFGEPDGAYTINANFQDLAWSANPTTEQFVFILDDTAPIFGALNPAPVGSAGTDASAIVITIGGTINDANIIDTAVLSVFSSVDADCATAGDNTKLSVTGGAIDRNDIEVANGTNAVSFNETFTIQQPSTAMTTSNYCFIHSATDEAVLKDGTDTGNSSSLKTLVVVVWNAG